MKKFSNVILKIFSAGVLLALFLGAFTLLGFIIAMFIGGDIATEMSVFIHKTFFPWLIRATSVFVGLGLLGMYLTKVKALSIIKNNTEKEITK